MLRYFMYPHKKTALCVFNVVCVLQMIYSPSFMEGTDKQMSLFYGLIFLHTEKQYIDKLLWLSGYVEFVAMRICPNRKRRHMELYDIWAKHAQTCNSALSIKKHSSAVSCRGWLQLNDIFEHMYCHPHTFWHLFTNLSVLCIVQYLRCDWWDLSKTVGK